MFISSNGLRVVMGGDGPDTQFIFVFDSMETEWITSHFECTHKCTEFVASKDGNAIFIPRSDSSLVQEGQYDSIEIYNYVNKTWILQRNPVHLQNSEPISEFSVNENGSRIAVSTPSSNAYIFQYNSSSEWEQIGYIENETELNYTKTSLSLNANGDILAIAKSTNQIAHLNIYQHSSSSSWKVVFHTVEEEEPIHPITTMSLSDAGYTIVACSSAQCQLYRNSWVSSPVSSPATFSTVSNKQYKVVSISGNGKVIAISTSQNPTENSFIDIYYRDDENILHNIGKLHSDLASDGENDYFGASISMDYSGNHVVVGEPGFGEERNPFGRMLLYEIVENREEDVI